MIYLILDFKNINNDLINVLIYNNTFMRASKGEKTIATLFENKIAGN